MKWVEQWLCYDESTINNLDIIRGVIESFHLPSYYYETRLRLFTTKVEI